MEAGMYNQLTISGRTLTGEEIVLYCEAQPEPNMRALGKFMREWLSPDPHIILQTSGSTGEPKQIIVLKSQMLSSAGMTADYFNFQAGQTALLCLPLQYIAAKMMVVRALYSKLNLILLEPKMDPLKDFQYEKEIDFIPLIPAQAQNINPELKIRQILLGGAPVHKLLLQELMDKPYAVYHSYGMTETLSHIAIRRINGPSASQYFRILKGVSIKQDERDCLRISVPFLEEEIQTNDVVELLGTDSFYWKGRYDNIINSGGLKFFPELIEQKIETIVKYPYFIGSVNDKVLGEKIVLCVELPESEIVQNEDLKSHLTEVLTKYENPKEVIYFTSFERTASGKVQRRNTLNKLKR